MTAQRAYRIYVEMRIRFISLRVLLFAFVCAFMPCLVQATESKSANAYTQTILVANSAHYKPTVAVDPSFVDAWGISIPTQGVGGHFWVTANDTSYQYLGDVTASPNTSLRKLHQDQLKTLLLPVGRDYKNRATGVVFNNSQQNFMITQIVSGAGSVTAPAKFIFSSDGGVISVWAERKYSDGSLDQPTNAAIVIDYSSDRSKFMGIAISKNYDRLYVADFGVQPAIRVFDGKFRAVKIDFENPFDDNKNGKVDPGEYAPFNVQAVTTPDGKSRIFVTYAKSLPCPKYGMLSKICKDGEVYPGQADTREAGNGRVAEFTENGALVAVLPDAGKLSAPWGVVYAPANFGRLSNMLLVSNFGDGTIAAFNPKTYEFIDVLRTPNKKPVRIDRICGLLFGNGESLGDANALYFAAGPNDGKDGVLGSLRLVK